MPNSKSENNPSSKKPRKPQVSGQKAAVPELSEGEERFDPKVLDRMVIALPLMEILKQAKKSSPRSI